ncbi:Ig-like domain-containing protein [uncultured Mycolicibacterium sp.]|uniref:Ig-like domain-containing protein n=1 Tax=uncultured Mycolicibacterium sp. TaxID=2320817 RepID=UPI00260B5E04|nr:Ig-like domain-containing protein [uncultured Mycolicibacterium sp.]
MPGVAYADDTDSGPVASTNAAGDDSAETGVAPGSSPDRFDGNRTDESDGEPGLDSSTGADADNAVDDLPPIDEILDPVDEAITDDGPGRDTTDELEDGTPGEVPGKIEDIPTPSDIAETDDDPSLGPVRDRGHLDRSATKVVQRPAAQRPSRVLPVDSSRTTDQLTPEAVAVGTAEPPARTQLRPVVRDRLETVGLVLPRAFVDAVASVVGMLLTPFIGPYPDPPAQPPLLWAVLAWVRREINRAFFNTPPVIGDQEFSLTLEPGRTSAVVPVGATDRDGDPIRFVVPERGQPGGPRHGTVTVGEDGAVIYTPDAGFTGTDTFTVHATDAGAPLHLHGLLSLFGWHTAQATVTVHVERANGWPIANDDWASTLEGTPVSGNVLLNDVDPDGDPLTVELDSGPAHGTIVIDPLGEFVYTPNAGFSGIDSFTYRVSDGRGGIAIGTVRIDVVPVNDPPFADDAVYTTLEDHPVGGRLHFGDPDGDPLTVELDSGPAHGTIVIDPLGEFVYTPNAGFSGIDSFTYRVSDERGGIAVGKVWIEVIAVPDPPVAVPDEFTVSISDYFGYSGTGPIVQVNLGNVLANDPDPEGALHARLVSANNRIDLPTRFGIFVFTINVEVTAYLDGGGDLILEMRSPYGGPLRLDVPITWTLQYVANYDGAVPLDSEPATITVQFVN